MGTGTIMFEKVSKFRKYKFTDKKRSKGGMISSLLLVLEVVLLGYSIYLAYKSAGNGGIEVGLMAFMALVLSLIGFFIGVRSFKEDNVFFGYSWFGTIGNTLVWMLLGGLMLVGL